MNQLQLGICFLSSLFMLSACGGGAKVSGVFGTTSCTTPSCTSIASTSIRIANDSSNLLKQTDKQVQIGGYCNPGDYPYHQIFFKIERTKQSCTDIYPVPDDTGLITPKNSPVYCENGRFNMIYPLVLATIGAGCKGIVQFTVTAQMYYGSVAPGIAGPKHSSDISIQY